MKDPGSERHFFIVDKDLCERLDSYIANKFEDYSRSYLKRLISDGLVTVDGRATKPSTTLRGGEKVEVEIPPLRILAAEPENIPIEILFEDESLLLVNKPAGMVVHPAPGNESGTLVNALLHHCDNLSGIGGVLRPGIVHRLDVGTTGVILVAKSDRAHMHLTTQFQERKIDKIYKAVVFGRTRSDEGKIDNPIGRDVNDRKKMSVNTKRGREALSRYRVELRWDEFSLISVELMTGRTHQIRVHLCHIGHPIVGDKLYGGNRHKSVINRRLRKLADKFGRPALHAHTIGFDHPESGERVTFKAPLPEDMNLLVEDLGESI